MDLCQNKIEKMRKNANILLGPAQRKNIWIYVRIKLEKCGKCEYIPGVVWLGGEKTYQSVGKTYDYGRT